MFGPNEIKHMLYNFNPVSSGSMNVKFALQFWIRVVLLPSNEKWMNSLKDDLQTEVLFHHDLVYAHIALKLHLEDPNVLIEFVYQMHADTNCLLSAIEYSLVSDGKDKIYAYHCIESMKTPLKTSSITGKIFNEKYESEPKMGHSIA